MRSRTVASAEFVDYLIERTQIKSEIGEVEDPICLRSGYTHTNIKNVTSIMTPYYCYDKLSHLIITCINDFLFNFHGRTEKKKQKIFPRDLRCNFQR